MSLLPREPLKAKVNDKKMALNTTDRILTVVVTATLTSAAWIIAGGSLMENAGSEGQIASTRPAHSAPSPVPPADGPSDPALANTAAGDAAKALDTVAASQPLGAEGRNLIIPVLNVRSTDLTDTFTDDRRGGRRLHEAIDIMAPEGTSVVAAAPGTVERLFVSQQGGNTIYVRSADRLTIHYYAHLAEYAPGLKEGQRVRRGQRLGSVGSTGNASIDAPHLHYSILRTTADAEWWEPSNAINPYPLLTGDAAASSAA
ncbi:M23 family metallopeptidase [Pseudopontixanthobacter vadosimaris]|uniref:M23 family metallopeptidase n=1 Tax=Pseudopontixanthobacter vadosimaris TaxID=2726450 RepID=UPI001F0E8967|nr:M23 family metallopeptidase [Pseudopontixanthobacter vadosimaris]